MSFDMNKPDILNCIAGIGVCVVAQDNFEPLYSNDTFKHIKNRLWPTENFTSLRTEGSQRLLKAAEAENGFSTVFRDPKSDENLDITCNLTVWEGDRSAYVLTIKPHVRLDEEEIMLWDRQMIDALKRVYPMIMSVNLTKDTYSVIETTGNQMDYGASAGRYSTLHLKGLASTHPDYREAFAGKFSRENLLARYAAGEEEEYLEARQMGPDRRYHWSSTHAIRVNNPYNDDVLQFILIRPIDDQRELEDEVERIRSEANRYRNAITMTYDHIYEVDVNRDCVYEIKLNNGIVDRAELGSICDMNTKLILDRMHPSKRDSFGDELPWMKLLRGDIDAESGMKIYEDDWYLRQSSGLYRWERIQIIRGLDNPDEIMIFSKDIHEVKLREEKERELLFEALAGAEQANAAKRDFLSRMSHDMRTPMNAIVGLTTIAQAKIGDDEKVADALEKIQTSSQHLLRLINEVLDMSRIESGKITLEEEQFSISEMLESVMTSIRTQAKDKEQMLVVDTQELSHGWFLGDRFRLEQILLNILSNAVKYTGREGFVMLSLCDTPSQHENVANLTICVEDNGVGMSEEFVTRLFEPFEREIQPETANEQGTGLGLPIVKNIVDRMNGTIRVESALGMGTCFSVNVPIKVPGGAAAGGAVEIRYESSGDNRISEDRFAGLHFLLVDDNELNREIGQELLQMFGAKVDLATNGQEAIDILYHTPEGQYDAVFMDVQMPVKNGYDATRELRAGTRQDIQELPIFAMTANAFADDVQDALDAGMTAHLAKPLDLDTLKRVLDRYIRRG